MKYATDAGQSSNKLVEITPFIPLILRGIAKEATFILAIPLLR